MIASKAKVVLFRRGSIYIYILCVFLVRAWSHTLRCFWVFHFWFTLVPVTMMLYRPNFEHAVLCWKETGRIMSGLTKPGVGDDWNCPSTFPVSVIRLEDPLLGCAPLKADLGARLPPCFAHVHKYNIQYIKYYMLLLSGFAPEVSLTSAILYVCIYIYMYIE